MDGKLPGELPGDFVRTPDTGLTAAEAETRRQAGKGNIVHTGMEKSVWQILKQNIFTFFNLLNAVLAFLLAVVGSYRNMLFLGTVIINTLIGTFQELRARQTLARLTLLNSPKVSTLRDGQEVTLRPEETVCGDVVVLRPGDQVPADAVVTGGSGAANESMLTGESDPVRKADGDWLMSGSFVTEGRLTAQLVYVGDESYAARLAKEARAIRRPKSILMTEMNRLIRIVTVLLLPLGILLFCRQFILGGRPVEQVIPNVVASMVGMIPNGLVLLVSVALFVGVVRLGRKNTLVQELFGIETLARADVLCLDKTGTLTTGQMKAEMLVPCDVPEDELKRELSRFLGAFEDDNATSRALRQLLTPEKSHPTGILPFSSARKKSAASFEDGVTLCLGASRFVWQGDLPDDVSNVIREQSALGNRMLVFCRGKGLITGEEHPPMTEVLGLCVLSDELRPNARVTLQTFRKNNVDVRIISGDDPRTVSSIAGKLGLEGAERYLDVSGMTEEQLQEAVDKYIVFGRVTPQQKCMLVEALKKQGHKVAMTGDGVNDIPAMKAADCSIAMGTGSDAARQTAQLTLLDSDFASMPLVVAEGRRVVGNVTRAATLFLVKTLYSIALTLLMVFLPLSYPFQPIQLTLIAALTIGVPSTILALEPNSEPIRGDFLKKVLRKAAPGAMAVTLSAVIAMAMEKRWSPETCSTVASLCAGFTGVMMLINVCRPFSKVRACVTAGMAILLTAAMILVGQVFYIDLQLITAQVWPHLLLSFLACGTVVFGGSILLEKLFGER